MRSTIKPNINIVIADDHEIFRDGIEQVFASNPNITVMDTAANGMELLKKIEQHQPDIVLSDIKMPVLDGIETCKKIIENHPDIQVIGLSMFDDETSIVDMLEAGARGYLIKNADKSEIIDAIYTVFEGDPYYCKHTSFTLAKMISSSRFNPNKKKKKIEFTVREKEVIALICKQLTNKEIAEALFISPRTVEGHRLKIQEKLEVRNSIGIAVYAIKNGLFIPD